MCIFGGVKQFNGDFEFSQSIISYNLDGRIRLNQFKKND